MRRLYRLLLRLHPKPFRERFEPEMLCIFDDASQSEGNRRLILDVFASLLRQWIFRPRAARSALRTVADAPQMFGSITPSRQNLRLRVARLLFGMAFSFALFTITGALLGRGGGHRSIGKPFYGAESKLTQALTPSDLVSISDECAPGMKRDCIAPAGVRWPAMPAQSRPYALPYPSGRFGIGQASYGFAETASVAASADSGELKVSIWYPAEIDTGTAVPVQNVWDFSRATGKFVETHTVENAKVTGRTARFPLILFRPATGNSSAAYLSQIENLVSHGYIVACVEPTDAVPNAEFRDTRLTVFEHDMRSAYFVPASRDENAVLSRAAALEQRRESAAASELRFAFNQIILLASGTSKDVPFRGRIDLEHAGAFGHGSGGNAIARFCESDPRIAACLDEDGWTPEGPLSSRGRAVSFEPPFLWIDAHLAAPDAAELSYARMTREQFTRLADQSERAADSELASFAKGAYRISLAVPGISDQNFTDGPLVWSMSRQRAGDFQARTALALTNIYARAFFDKYLKGKSAALLDSDAHSPSGNVRLRRYPPKH